MLQMWKGGIHKVKRSKGFQSLILEQRKSDSHCDEVDNREPQ
jgi:hypothetical protein